MSGKGKIVGIWPASETSEGLGEPLATPELEPLDLGPADMAGPDVADPALAAEPVAPVAAWEEPIFLDDTQSSEGQTPGRWFGWALLFISLIWFGLAVASLTAAFTRWPTGLPDAATVASIVLPLLLSLAAVALLRGSGLGQSQRYLNQIARLRLEQDALEERLSSMSAQWQLAQQQLIAQADALSHHGLDASARMQTAGSAIAQQLVQATDAAAALGERAELAQRYLDGLQVAMPKLEDMCARLADNLRTAGQSAYQYGGQMEAKMAAIATEAANAQQQLQAGSVELAVRADALRQAVQLVRNDAAEAGRTLDQAMLGQREQALTMMAEFAASVNETSIASLGQLDALRERVANDLQAGLASIDASSTLSEQRVTAMRDALADTQRRGEELDQTLNAIAVQAESRLASVADSTQSRFAQLEQAVGLLSAGVERYAAQAQAGDDQTAQLIARAESLLVALDAAAREIEGTLPRALEQFDDRVNQSVGLMAGLAPLAGEARAISDELTASLVAANGSLTSQRDQLSDHATAARQHAEQQQAALASMAALLDGVEQRIRAVSEEATPALTEQLAGAEAAAIGAGERTRETINHLLDEMSSAAEERVAQALDRAVGDTAAARLAAVGEAAERAVQTATGATDRLMRQLITIGESSAALEQRAQEVDMAAARQEQQSLARQLTALTEALQSTSLDLVRMLDSDVADQAWESYMRGDRSIFARRAARLVGYGESREIRRLYGEDEGFRAQVNRYIADFEAMLRGVMDGRDGGALSVTLLSSDIGKLYVGLAQAIERLRS